MCVNGRVAKVQLAFTNSTYFLLYIVQSLEQQSCTDTVQEKQDIKDYLFPFILVLFSNHDQSENKVAALSYPKTRYTCSNIGKTAKITEKTELFPYKFFQCKT